MAHERIEIKLSKVKGILGFLGSCAFVATSFWLLSIADKQDRFNPILVTSTAYAGLVFFGLAGLYIFYKLFDTKPGLIIDDEGIYDNSSAAAGHMIRWERIKGLRIEQVASTKFILIDIEEPEQFMDGVTGMRKKLMWSTYKMYGTPVSIASAALRFSFDELFTLLNDRLKVKKLTSIFSALAHTPTTDVE
jgi:hypothetical protein